MSHTITTIINTSAEKNKTNDDHIEHILQSLDFLKDEAQKIGEDDIYKLIDSFTTCLRTYCVIKRNGMQACPSSEPANKA